MRTSLQILLAFLLAAYSFTAQADQVYVIGGGAVGALFGSQLAPKHDVTIVKRREPQEPTMQIKRADYPTATVNQTSWDSIDKFPNGAVVVVAVKSFDLAETWASLAPRLDGSQTVVLTQNGIDVAKEAAGLANYPNLVRALVLTGTKFENGNLTVAGQTAVRLASREEFDGLESLAKTLTESSFKVVSSERDIAQAEWKKALLNLYINGPTAVFGCTIGEVLDTPARLAFAEHLLDEAVTIARKEKIAVSETDIDAVRNKARELSAHRTSMQQDIERQAPTEKKWLYGAVAAKAAALGIKTRYTDRVLHLLGKREAGHRAYPCLWSDFTTKRSNRLVLSGSF